MKAKELREKYFKFFQSKKHKLIASASIFPENDPTALFTTAGMQPLVPFLSGQPHPQGKRIVNIQKCLRTVDFDAIGDTYHHTFFEMMGNWSIGDYFKKEAIEFTFEFFHKILKIPIEKLAVSCFKGNKVAPKDEEAEKVWLSLGITKERIAFLKKDNWWELGGLKGPCGPSTEIFFWKPETKAPKTFNPEDENWVEIGNDVLMGYEKKEGKYHIAKQKNIDFGGGFERILAVLNGFDDNYKTELFQPIIKKIESLSNKKYKDNKKEMRIIADHIKASTFLLGDAKSIPPSNTGQGYVLRRLIRRAIGYAARINLQNFCSTIAKEVIKIYKETYPELNKNKDFIIKQLDKEEERFNLTLEKGLNKFKKLANKNISGKDAFLLSQSYGFPIEMTIELANEKGIKVDEKEYKKELKKHQELSRTSTEGMFKSGLADNSEQTTKLHTATHLLLAALIKVLKKDIHQKGSNINPERARFDFNFDRKLTEEEVKEVEDLVNNWIKEGIKIKKEEMFLEEAKKQGAKGIFDSKYSEKVSVYSIGKISKEICTGPHIKNTKEIGIFKIKKQKSVGVGVRRIKATIS